MTKVPGTGGKFIKADELKQGDTAVIKTEADWIDSTFTKEDGSKQQQYVCCAEYNGEERRLKLTMASCQELSVLGDDSKEWIGETVNLEKVRVMVGGSTKFSILVTPVNGKAKPVEDKPVDW